MWYFLLRPPPSLQNEKTAGKPGAQQSIMTEAACRTVPIVRAGEDPPHYTRRTSDMTDPKRTIRSALRYLRVCGKWLALAVLAGCLTGPLGAAFGLAPELGQRPARAAGLAAVPAAPGRPGHRVPLPALRPRGRFHQPGCLPAVRERRLLPLRGAPLIFFSTVATHLLGGSSGREGAALLLGGSLLGALRTAAATGPPGLPPADHVRHGGGVFGHFRHAAGRRRLCDRSGGRGFHAVCGAAALPGLGPDRGVDQRAVRPCAHRFLPGYFGGKADPSSPCCGCWCWACCWPG